MTKIRQKLHIGEHQHGDQGDPYLRHGCVAAGTEESFDLQILLDPFEEQFDLPAGLVDIGDGFGGQVEIVGQKKYCLPVSGSL